MNLHDLLRTLALGPGGINVVVKDNRASVSTCYDPSVSMTSNGLGRAATWVACEVLFQGHPKIVVDALKGKVSNMRCPVCGKKTLDEYMLYNEVWAKMGLGRYDNLHLACLEKPLLRPLKEEDFPDVSVNDRVLEKLNLWRKR